MMLRLGVMSLKASGCHPPLPPPNVTDCDIRALTHAIVWKTLARKSGESDTRHTIENGVSSSARYDPYGVVSFLGSP